MTKHNQLCKPSKSLFVSGNFATHNLNAVMPELIAGDPVEFYYDGQYLGRLRFCGVVENIGGVCLDKLPYGCMVYDRSDDFWYISIPDDPDGKEE